MKAATTVLSLGLVAATLGAVAGVTRLNRLQVRIDAAWVALDAALSRRALVMERLDAPPTVALERGVPAGAVLRGGPAGREEMENELGRALAMLDRTRLDPHRAAQLADAEQRVIIARRVYNDAVRDTRALRSRRMVRWLRLAGAVPLPHYFDIVEPRVQDGTGA